MRICIAPPHFDSFQKIALTQITKSQDTKDNMLQATSESASLLASVTTSAADPHALKEIHLSGGIPQ